MFFLILIYKKFFQLPLKMLKLDLPTIIRNVANKVILWEVPCIKRAFTFQNNDGETILKTDGINIIVSKNVALILIFVFYSSIIFFFITGDV